MNIRYNRPKKNPPSPGIVQTPLFLLNWPNINGFAVRVEDGTSVAYRALKLLQIAGCTYTAVCTKLATYT